MIGGNADGAKLPRLEGARELRNLTTSRDRTYLAIYRGAHRAERAARHGGEHAALEIELGGTAARTRLGALVGRGSNLLCFGRDRSQADAEVVLLSVRIGLEVGVNPRG